MQGRIMSIHFSRGFAFILAEGGAANFSRATRADFNKSNVLFDEPARE